jgi:hypothetical protein
MAVAPWISVSNPDPQSRFMVNAGVVWGTLDFCSVYFPFLKRKNQKLVKLLVFCD